MRPGRPLRRRPPILLLGVWLAALGACGRGGGKPNVLLVTIDTLRADRLGAYGYGRAETPRLDALAARGALFRDAYAPTPYTLPSHASVLTGTLPPRHGIRDNGAYALPAEARTLAEIAREGGWRTGAFVGAFPLDARFGLDQGFERYDDELPRGGGRFAVPERRAEEVVARALSWLDEVSGEPFFSWIHLYDPHALYDPPEPFRTRFATRPYDGEIAYSDDCLGRVFDRLERDGLADRTLVVVTADHGEALGERGEPTHGVLLQEATVRVPLILAWTGRIPSGARPTGRARLVDLLPTVCEALRLPTPPACEGRSLLAATRGEPDDERGVFLETFIPFLHYRWAPLLGWRVGRWKFVLAPKSELYDLDADPKELRNLFDERRETAERLEKQLHQAARASAEGAFGSSRRPLTEEETERFGAIGYLWGGGSAGAPTGAEKDPKDMIAILPALDAASVALERGEFASAEARLRDVLSRDPENWFARMYLGELEEARGDLGAAARAYRELLALAPGDRQASVRLGRALCLLRLEAEALPVLEVLANSASPPLEALAWYGTALLATGRREEAKPFLERARAIEPEHPPTLHALALVARAEGRPQEAIEHLRRCANVGSGSESAPSRYLLAEILAERAADPAARSEALAHLEEVLRLYPRWKDALALKARLEAKTGEASPSGR